jgi:hypothetical protein
MDNQLNQPKPSVHKTDIVAIVIICLGFLFWYIGYDFMFFALLRFGFVLIAIGLIGIIYGAMKFKINRPVQFLVGFLCWLVSSFLINMLIIYDLFQTLQMIFVIDPFSRIHVEKIGGIIDISRALEVVMIATLIAIQLLGYGLAFLTFRKDKGWIGIGIIFASLLFLLGSIISSDCNPVGFPFPLSLVSFC